MSINVKNIRNSLNELVDAVGELQQQPAPQPKKKKPKKLTPAETQETAEQLGVGGLKITEQQQEAIAGVMKETYN